MLYNIRVATPPRLAKCRLRTRDLYWITLYVQLFAIGEVVGLKTVTKANTSGGGGEVLLRR